MILLVEGFQFGVGQALGVLVTGGFATLVAVRVARVLLGNRKK